MAEDADVNIQPITRADFVPAKVFRSRSMNTLAAGERHLEHIMDFEQVAPLAGGWAPPTVDCRWRVRLMLFLDS